MEDDHGQYYLSRGEEGESIETTLMLFECVLRFLCCIERQYVCMYSGSRVAGAAGIFLLEPEA